MGYFLKRWKQIKRVTKKEQGFSKINNWNCCFLSTRIPSTLSGDTRTVWSGVGGTVCKPSEVWHVFPSSWYSSILLLPTHSLSHPSLHVRFPRIGQTTHTQDSHGWNRGVRRAWYIHTAQKSLEEFLSLSDGLIRPIKAHKLRWIKYKVYRDIYTLQKCYDAWGPGIL